MLNIQEKQKYCNILGVSLDATQEEITKVYRKLAFKYHPDRNRGNEKWAKERFIEVGEAYESLSSSSARPGISRKKFQFSNKPGSDKFKEFEEMLREVTRDLDNIEENLNEQQESLDREREKIQNEAIRNMEENLSLAGVTSSDLDSSLWSPYSDWKEKVRNLVDSGLELFLSNMRIAIAKAKGNKSSYNQFGQGNYSHNDYSREKWQNPQQPRGNYGSYGDPQSKFGGKNFSPNNSGWTSGGKPFSTEGSRIQQLEAEIEYNRNFMFSTTYEDEKQKCQKIINRLEKELSKLRGSSNLSKGGKETPNPSFNSPSNYGSSGNSSENNSKKDEKINQLETEIEHLKKSKSWNPRQWQEDQKKISEKEKELSELREKNKDEVDNSSNQDQLIDELINEIERLKKENKSNDLTKKVGRLEKVMQQLLKEIQELRTEVKELKEQKEKGGNLSEYQTYYLNQQENQLKSKEQKFEKLKGFINSNSNSNSNNFPVGWVVGGGMGVVALIIIALIIRKKRKKHIKNRIV